MVESETVLTLKEYIRTDDTCYSRIFLLQMKFYRIRVLDRLN